MIAATNSPIFSTAWFPPVSYVASCMAYNEIVIETKETFPKQTYRNRCVILTAGGPLTLTIPVKKLQGSRTKTDEIEISNIEPWQRIQWRSISSAYSRSPYFDHYQHHLFPLFHEQAESLIEINDRSLHLVFKLLKLSCTLRYTNDYYSSYNGIDLRNTFDPKRPLSSDSFRYYFQVFGDRFAFQHDLSILDLLFNLGPESLNYLRIVEKSIQGKLF